MKLMLVFVFSSVVLHITDSANSHKVLRITPRDQYQIDIVDEFIRKEGQGRDFSYWKFSKKPNRMMDIMVSPKVQADFLQILQSNRIKHSIYIDDVEALIANAENDREMAQPAHMEWTFYYKLSEIYAWMREIRKRYPHRLEMIVGGQSPKAGAIRGLKLSYGPEPKPGIFIEGGIDPREWISPATVTYLLNKFLTSSDVAIRELAESYDWYFFPVFNPDGYQYSHQNPKSINNRLWAKTRGGNFNSSQRLMSIGTYLNSNWLLGGTDPIQTNASSQCYQGRWPFSEMESSTLSQFLNSIALDLFAYISFRGYGQELMFPYGYRKDVISNYDNQYKIAKKVKHALKKRFGTKYAYGTISSLKGVVPGSSVDWIKKEWNLPIVYTYYMRDTGHGFIVPTDQIIPNGQEVMDSLIAMFNAAKKLRYP